MEIRDVYWQVGRAVHGTARVPHSRAQPGRPHRAFGEPFQLVPCVPRRLGSAPPARPSCRPAQLRPAAAERLHELVQLLLGAGADPSLLDAPAAEAGAAMLAATAEEDGSDDEDLHSDDEAAAAAGGNAAAAASALSHRRRAWCLRRLGNRLETANMCQSPLR